MIAPTTWQVAQHLAIEAAPAAVPLGPPNRAAPGVGCLAHLRLAMLELLKAYDYARDSRRDIWQFGVNLASLQRYDLTETDCRWLVTMGYAEHAREITRQNDSTRQFRCAVNLSFSRRTCLTLTDFGASMIREIVGLQHVSSTAADLAMPHHTHLDPRPHWDNDRHELRLFGKVVKRFKWPAANQEMLLMAFQEEGWPVRIDDPLPPQHDQNSKRRLHDAIKCLNRNQKTRLLHFRGDGTGEGACWELVGEDNAITPV